MGMLPRTQRRALTLADVREILSAEVLVGSDLSGPVASIEAADLMSDVLALSKPGMLLLTGLLNPQVIRTAVIADLCGVVLVRGKKPAPDILGLARESNLALLSTSLSMFEAAGLLYCAMTGK